VAEEAEIAAAKDYVQAFEEEPAELPRQRVNRQKEVRLAGDPALAVEGNPPAWDETVDMRMMVSVWPQLCNTAIRPILADRRLAASVISA
jgi:hypothetical protein